MFWGLVERRCRADAATWVIVDRGVVLPLELKRCWEKVLHISKNMAYCSCGCIMKYFWAFFSHLLYYKSMIYSTTISILLIIPTREHSLCNPKKMIKLDWESPLLYVKTFNNLCNRTINPLFFMKRSSKILLFLLLFVLSIFTLGFMYVYYTNKEKGYIIYFSDMDKGIYYNAQYGIWTYDRNGVNFPSRCFSLKYTLKEIEKEMGGFHFPSRSWIGERSSWPYIERYTDIY